MKKKIKMNDVSMTEGSTQDNEENDPVVKEIDVYLAKSLASNIYVLQVIIRQITSPSPLIRSK